MPPTIPERHATTRLPAFGESSHDPYSPRGLRPRRLWSEKTATAVADRLVVVDASVALKRVVTEDGSDAANDHLDRARDGLTLAAPEHLLGEVGNGLRKRVAQKVLSPSDAVNAFAAIGQLGLESVGGADRWHRTLRAALDWNLETYDALCLLLAQDLDADLVTADGRLLESARHHGLPARPLSG